MPSLFETLKQSTAGHHARLERRMMMFDQDYSRVDYLALLQAFFGYYQPLEAHLAAVDGFREVVPDLGRRFKSDWIATDLQALGMAPAAVSALPRCQVLPRVTDRASAFGCLYVLEGATLGARIIGPRLQRSLGIDHETGGRFFAAYDTDTAGMWESFRACGDRAIAGTPAEPDAIGAACETFTRLEAWLEQAGLLREESRHD